MKKVSVIVPIYNAEKYIERCMQSLAQQEYENIEVILIDDGSTDNSGPLCKEFCEKDKRFKYIYKENGGVSSARNLGIENSSGNYIAFTDADDYVEKSFISKMIEAIDNNSADAAMCRINITEKRKRLSKEQASFYEKSFDGNVTSKEAIHIMFEMSSYGTMICNKMFARNIIFDNGTFIRFPEEIRCGEDQIWIIKVLFNAKTVCFLKDELYIWVENENSASRSMANYEILIDEIKVQSICLGLLEKYGSNELAQPIKDRLVDKIYAYRLYTYMNGTKEQNKTLKGIQKENKYIKHSPIRFKTLFKKKVITLFMDLGLSKSLINKLKDLG